jgi:uncharacterized protein YceK
MAKISLVILLLLSGCAIDLINTQPYKPTPGEQYDASK